MKYGYFDDEKREYVVTNPQTKVMGELPWVSTLWCYYF